MIGFFCHMISQFLPRICYTFLWFHHKVLSRLIFFPYIKKKTRTFAWTYTSKLFYKALVKKTLNMPFLTLFLFFTFLSVFYVTNLKIISNLIKKTSFFLRLIKKIKIFFLLKLILNSFLLAGNNFVSFLIIKKLQILKLKKT